jgi:hypothetical protein
MLTIGDYIFEVSCIDSKPSIILYNLKNNHLPIQFQKTETERLVAEYTFSLLSGKVNAKWGYLNISNGINHTVNLAWSDF